MPTSAWAWFRENARARSDPNRAREEAARRRISEHNEALRYCANYIAVTPRLRLGL